MKEKNMIYQTCSTGGICDTIPPSSGGGKENFMTGERIGFIQNLASVDIGYRANQNVQRIQGMVSFKCSDIGIDCPFEAQATTDHEIMRKFIDHAESDHKMKVLSADVFFNVQNAIKKKCACLSIFG